MCDVLVDGRLTGVDRSATMIEAATRRNAEHVAAGRAEFLVGLLDALDLGERRFDLVFAVRVRAFHIDLERARTLVAPWLAPAARVRSFMDSPA